MSRLSTFSHNAWTPGPGSATAASLVADLEDGAVLFLPELRFAVLEPERTAFSPDVLATSKNVSFDPAAGRLSGTSLDGARREALAGLLRRFSEQALAFVQAVMPEYRTSIRRGRASFRPAEIAGRAASWRKDDTRLHVDSFPASPVQGDRILRLFTNVNPAGRPRSWRIGGEFASVAARFAPTLRLPWAGTATLLRLLRITKARRSLYDALMLQLHDRMKADAEFQAASPQQSVDFPAESTWIAFTDEVSHAAMAGQYQLEQTFLMPIAAMHRPERSPLRILEKLVGRTLTDR